MQVAVSHANGHLESELSIPLLSYFPGVPIFFLVSGFLISLSYERSGSISVYALNRVLRIYPALWFCFILSVCSVLIAGYSLSFDFDFALWAFAQNTFVTFYHPDFLRGYGVGVLNGSLWTISTELSFYFGLPLIYYFGKRFVNIETLLVILIIISVIIDQYYLENVTVYGDEVWFKLIDVSLLPYLWMFLIGVLFQRQWLKINSWVSDKFYIWGSVLIGLFVVDYFLGFLQLGNHPSFLYFVILSFFIISFAFHANGRWSKWLKGNDFSYGIYIYHMVVVNFMLFVGFSGSVQYLVICMMVTLLLSLIPWEIIERPSLRLKLKSIRSVEKNY